MTEPKLRSELRNENRKKKYRKSKTMCDADAEVWCSCQASFSLVRRSFNAAWCGSRRDLVALQVCDDNAISLI